MHLVRDRSQASPRTSKRCGRHHTRPCTATHWGELISEAHQADKYSRRLGERITDGYAAKFQRLGDHAGNAPWGLRRGGEAHTQEVWEYAPPCPSCARRDGPRHMQ